ncbi:polysaccharide biosynthesis C-terminal domain-containing protein [Amnibacterium endophyticum]|uniref:Polysaccharide biosynthesis C-terminal domain-containing protein n=1 Tax=Amnibacterium endophyticum TaxID=2109337 RepID=A0ABW4LAG0_9MICO
MAGGARWASRLSGFVLATALTGIVGFATIPALIAASGAGEWSLIAFGQAVGVLGTVLIGWGWAVSGAAEAALATEEESDALLLRSIAIRLLLVPPVALVGGGIALLLAPHDPWLAAMSAVAYSLNGMTAAWFYTGIRAPRLLVLREVLPRCGAIVIGLVVCALLHSAYPFPPLMAAGVLLGVVLNVRGAGGSFVGLLRRHGRAPLPELRRQLPALWSMLVSTSYVASPMILVGVLAPQALVVYALADRLYRTANMAGLPILNLLQGSIPAHDPDVFRRRVLRGLRTLLVLGLTGAVAFAVGAPLVAPLLTNGEYGLPVDLTIAFGVTLMASYFSQVLGLSVLVALGRVRSVAISSTVAAVVGVPVLVLGTIHFGATGAAAGVALAEVAVTLYQLWALRDGLRGLRRSPRTLSVDAPTDRLAGAAGPQGEAA